MHSYCHCTEKLFLKQNHSKYGDVVSNTITTRENKNFRPVTCRSTWIWDRVEFATKPHNTVGWAPSFEISKTLKAKDGLLYVLCFTLDDF